MYINSSLDNGNPVFVPEGLVNKISIFSDLQEISTTPEDSVPIPFSTEYLEYFVSSFERGYSREGFTRKRKSNSSAKRSIDLIRFAMYLGADDFLEQVKREVDYLNPHIYLLFYSYEYDDDDLWHEVFSYFPFSYIPSILRDNDYFVRKWLDDNSEVTETKTSEKNQLRRFLQNIIPSVAAISPIPGNIINRLFLGSMNNSEVTLTKITAPEYETTYIITKENGDEIQAEVLENYFHLQLRAEGIKYSYFNFPPEYQGKVIKDIMDESIKEVSVLKRKSESPLNGIVEDDNMFQLIHQGEVIYETRLNT